MELGSLKALPSKVDSVGAINCNGGNESNDKRIVGMLKRQSRGNDGYYN